MKALAAAVGWARLGVWLAASGAWGLAGCGGGDPSSEDVQAMASTAVGGQAMPAALGIQTTQRVLDVAIDGGGAFVLVDPSNGTLVLSRRGQFDIDSRGRVVNDEGWLVTGVAADAVPSTLADLKPLPVVTATLPPVATTRVTVEANLDARGEIKAGANPPDFDPNDAKTYNNATSVNVYDAMGNEVSVTFFFAMLTPSVWVVYAEANRLPVHLDNKGRRQPIVHLTFPPNGAGPINPADARLPLPTVVIDIPAQRYPSGYSTSAIAGVEVDFSTMTSYGAIFGVIYALQDGSPPGTLNYAKIKATGELEAHYSDGRVDRSRRLALARVTVADRLHSYGVSGWLCGRGCQTPVVAFPGQMLTGMLVPGALNAAN